MGDEECDYGTEVEKLIWNLLLVLDILIIYDFKCKVLRLCLYSYMVYKYRNCVYILGHSLNLSSIEGDCSLK
jgi:hypothetical protein